MYVCMYVGAELSPRTLFFIFLFFDLDDMKY
jgi:hypothetical protein